MWSVILNLIFLWNRADGCIVLKRVLYYLGIKMKFERSRMDLQITFAQKTLILILSWSFCWVHLLSWPYHFGWHMPLFLLGICCDGGWFPMVFFYWMYASCFSLASYEWLAYGMLCIWWDYYRCLQKCIGKSCGCYRLIFFLRVTNRKALDVQSISFPTKTTNEIKWPSRGNFTYLSTLRINL